MIGFVKVSNLGLGEVDFDYNRGTHYLYSREVAFILVPKPLSNGLFDPYRWTLGT
jgi:hypothetical protein